MEFSQVWGDLFLQEPLVPLLKVVLRDHITGAGSTHCYMTSLSVDKTRINFAGYFFSKKPTINSYRYF